MMPPDRFVEIELSEEEIRRLDILEDKISNLSAQVKSSQDRFNYLFDNFCLMIGIDPSILAIDSVHDEGIKTEEILSVEKEEISEKKIVTDLNLDSTPEGANTIIHCGSIDEKDKIIDEADDLSAGIHDSYLDDGIALPKKMVVELPYEVEHNSIHVKLHVQGSNLVCLLHAHKLFVEMLARNFSCSVGDWVVTKNECTSSGDIIVVTVVTRDGRNIVWNPGVKVALAPDISSSGDIEVDMINREKRGMTVLGVTNEFDPGLNGLGLIELMLRNIKSQALHYGADLQYGVTHGSIHEGDMGLRVQDTKLFYDKWFKERYKESTLFAIRAEADEIKEGTKSLAHRYIVSASKREEHFTVTRRSLQLNCQFLLNNLNCLSSGRKYQVVGSLEAVIHSGLLKTCSKALVCMQCALEQPLKVFRFRTPLCLFIVSVCAQETQHKK